MTNAPELRDLPERVIKKYPNRRLYDTHKSMYITLLDLREMVRKEVSFAVLDAKTGEDLTRGILLQIVLEEESGDTPLLSSEALLQMIRCYGHPMQGMLRATLEKSIQTCADANSGLIAADSMSFVPQCNHDQQTLFAQQQVPLSTRPDQLFGGFPTEQVLAAPQPNP